MLSLPLLSLKQKILKQKLARMLEMDMVMFEKEQDEQFSKDGELGSLAILYEIIIDILMKISPHSGNALDVGSGSGQLLSKIALAFPNLNFTGIELSPNMIHYCKKNIQKYDVPNVNIIQKSWYELNKLNNQKYDLITWNLALHHCDTQKQVTEVINDLKNLLNPNGTLFLFDIERPKTGKIALGLCDIFNDKWGSWYYQDSLDSYKAAFSFDEMEEIIKNSNLKNFTHSNPLMANFWQFVYISSQNKSIKYKRNVKLKTLFQKTNYILLKFNLIGRIS